MLVLILMIFSPFFLNLVGSLLLFFRVPSLRSEKQAHLLTRQPHKKPDTRHPNVFKKITYLGRIGARGTKDSKETGVICLRPHQKMCPDC